MTAKKYTTPIRWGIIGCGNVTEIKSGPAYQKVNGFELSAVMRRDIDKLKIMRNAITLQNSIRLPRN